MLFAMLCFFVSKMVFTRKLVFDGFDFSNKRILTVFEDSVEAVWFRLSRIF